MSEHPDLARFAEAFRLERFGDALSLVDGLITRYPDSPALRWNRVECLEKLGRYGEIRPELDLLLRLDPDHVPAIVKRVEYAHIEEEEGDADEDDSPSEAERAQWERERAERARQHSLEAEEDLRRALMLDANHVDALQLLSAELRSREDWQVHAAEAEALLDRAIELAPERFDLLETRANWRRGTAVLGEDSPDDGDTIRTFGGLRYSRQKLEAALADYESCFTQSGDSRYAVRLGMVLHDLGRYDQALERFDLALAAMPGDDPKRAAILDIRARSENNGAGERDQMARLLESSVLGDQEDRSAEEDIAAQNLLAVANAIRAGRPIGEAVESRLGDDDPDLILATSIAQQILNQACEPPPELVSVDPGGYPAYQRKFADRTAREMEDLGMRWVCDGEAKGLFKTLGQHVLLRFFADAGGETGIACFALKPKRPNWLGFVILLLSGKWKVTSMVECVTQFDDGTHLSTQHENPSPFQYGGTIQIEKLPRKTPVKRLVERHMERVAEYRRLHPASTALVATDIAGMDHRWREGQRVKSAYRASIGYVTDGELRGLLGRHYDRFGEKVRRQLALLAADIAPSGGAG
jgi:tetratricopeptide (TPR) repeat protein